MKKQVTDFRKYIGRDYDKCNCFDLVKEFYFEFFNLDIKNYFEGPVPDKKTVASLIVSNKGDFIRIAGRPQFGDIVVIRLFGIECHIGVCISSTQFLHSAKNIGSNLERIERYSKMIAGYYRHRLTV